MVLHGSHGGIYSMAAVLIACPESGGLVPTGVNVRDLDELDAENVLIDCPDCGLDHPWTKFDAVLPAYTDVGVRQPA
jgi:hypothetical protein